MRTSGGKLEAQQGQQALIPAQLLLLCGTQGPRPALKRMLSPALCSVPCCLEHPSISSLAWAAARTPTGVLQKGLYSSTGLLPALIPPPVPHRQPRSLFSVFP